MIHQTDTKRLFPPTDIVARNRVLVLGVGGAGCNMVARMAGQWGKDGPDVAVVNTDAQVLAACPVDRVYLLGEQTTQRMGAAGDPETGRLAAEECAEAIATWIAGRDLVFLVTGLGGGTGTGATPVIAREIHKAGGLSLCFATMPFTFEGDRRKKLAEDGLRVLQRVADAVITLPNEKLIDLVDRDAGFSTTFETSDSQVAACIYTIWKLLAEPGVINLDFADIRHLVDHSRGACAYGYGEGEGKSRTADALQGVLSSPWLDQGHLLTETTGILVNILGGPDLTLADVQGAVGKITEKLPRNAKVYMGASILPAWRERMAITLIAAQPTGNKPVRPPHEGLDLDLGPPTPVPEKRGKGAKKDNDLVQPTLPLEDAQPVTKRFRDSTPTIVNGQDLDMPTYLRRGIKLSFER